MAYQAPSIGPQGLVIPSYQDILAYELNAFTAIYGNAVYLDPSASDYQWIAVFSQMIADAMSTAQLIYSNRGPGTALGSALDGIVKLNGLVRKPVTFSTCAVTLFGTAYTVVNGGSVQDQNGISWSLPSLVTILGSGSVTVTATCATPGPITANPGTLTIIATPTAGWVSVTNNAPAVPGLPIEADSTLRARQAVSVALPSRTMLAGTTAAVAATAGVTRYSILENPTASTDNYGNPPHSITCVVEGGTDGNVAQAIYNNRGIGCYTNGTTSQTVTDAVTGQQMTINFYRPSYLSLYVAIGIHALTGYTTATQAAVQTALVNYLNSLQIGAEIVLSVLNQIAMAVSPNPAQPQFSIRSLEVGTQAVQTTGTTTSGTTSVTVAAATGIATGQTVSGAGIPIGATVAGISGTTVTLSQAATASGSNVTLTFFALSTNDIVPQFYEVASGNAEYVAVTTA